MTRQHIGRACWLLAAVALALGFALLGHWQLQRMAYKQAMLDSQAAAGSQQALGVAAALARASAVVAVADCGQWQPLQLVLDNQQRNGRAGHISYQLLRSDDGQRVLVELGWRAWDGRRSPPAIELLQGHHCLHGQLLPAPAVGLRLSSQASAALPTAGSWLLSALDPVQVAALAGLEPAQLPAAVLRPDPALALGYARDNVLLPNTLPPHKHLGYAVQWFALAAAVLLLAMFLSLRGWRGRQGRGGRGRMP